MELPAENCFYVFDPTNGQIRYTVNHPAPAGMIDVWKEKGEAYVLGQKRDIATHYVDLDRATQLHAAWDQAEVFFWALRLAIGEAIIERPAWTPSVSTAHIEVGEDTSYISLPPELDCQIVVDGQDAGLYRDSFEIAADTPGTYRVDVHAFPYLSFSVDIEATA